jgi:hypothetical protein
VAVASFTSVLSHPAWTAAATLLAAIAIGLTIVLYRRGKARKAVTCVLSSTSLVSVRSEARGKIEIVYEGHPVGGVHLVSFSLANSGNVPVVRDDFERALIVELGPGATPLEDTIEVKEKRPSDLHPNVYADGSRLILDPLLLNPGDSFSIAALVRDFTGPLTIDGRIAGVSKLGVRGAGLDADGFGPSRLKKVGWWTQGAAGIAAVVGVVAALAAIFAPIFIHKTHTKVLRRDGTTLCGKVLRVDASHVVVQLKGRGLVRIVPASNVAAIRDNAC